MLAEIIIYIALFVALFSGAFAAAFQGIDALSFLEQKKETLDAQSFLAARLQSYLESSGGWSVLADGTLQFEIKNIPYILFLENSALKIKCASCSGAFEQTLSAENLQVGSFLPQIIETAGSSIKILNLSVTLNQTNYVFSYYVQK